MSNIKLKPIIRRELPDVRRAEAIDAALRLARVSGAQGLVRDRIAAEAGQSGPLISKYFGPMDLVREKVIERAFELGDTQVLFKSLSIEDFKKLNTNPALAKELGEYVAIT
jgi:DNA-binding transcriptional regulator YbjK